MIVWLVWEFAESAGDLRALLRAYVAGSWVLAVLTLANFASAEAMAAEQIRFAAAGQDPNDVARFLNLGFPLAALLVNSERRWPWRLLAAGLPAAGAGCRVAHSLSRRVSGGRGGAGGQRQFCWPTAIRRGCWPERWHCRRLPRCCGGSFPAAALSGWPPSASSFRAAA